MTLERASSLARLARVHAPSGAPACEPGLGVQSSGGVAVFTVAFGLISVGGAAQVSSEADVALARRADFAPEGLELAAAQQPPAALVQHVDAILLRAEGA